MSAKNAKERKPWDTNRDIARRAKLGKGWCLGCDAYLVEDGRTCPVCKRRARQKRNKKSYPD